MLGFLGGFFTYIVFSKEYVCSRLKHVLPDDFLSVIGNVQKCWFSLQSCQN